MKTIIQTALLLSIVLGFAGCSSSKSQPANLTLATTTSTQDSGLLDDLLPAFEKQTGIKVKVVAAGSGQALELGRRGDADVLLTHSPDAEQKFMDEGFGSKRFPVMHNDFIIAGPLGDPAKIKQCSTGAEAFRMIFESNSPFVSRGDESGTHHKELAIWKLAGVEPSGKWYIKAGSGMAQGLRIADEKHAYVLTDRATYLALKQELEIGVLLDNEERLLNRYSVITLSKVKNPHIRDKEANAFAEYLTSEAGQNQIAAFGVEEFGEPLFVPDARR